MKFGIRTPSFKKSIKARTTGKRKRKVKKAVNPFYGKKGMGYIKNPKRAVYNRIYRRTTVSPFRLWKGLVGTIIGLCLLPFYIVIWPIKAIVQLFKK